MSASQAGGKITVLATDIPFPPNRGGRADIWRRLFAFHQLGLRTQLFAYYDDKEDLRPSDEHQQAVRQVVDELHLIPIRMSIRARLSALAQIGRMPLHTARRALSTRGAKDKFTSAARAFKPDWVWCEGPWCGDLALALHDRLRAPLVYRSHNIEHKYMARQAAAARRVRDQLAWRLTCVGLQRYEKLLMSRALWVYDISLDDLTYWQGQGVAHASWLPPLAESALSPDVLAATALAPPPTLDVVFLGNLTTPNNIRGIEWLVSEIRPRVLLSRPDTRFVIAGSNPGRYVRALCEAPGVELRANVSDPVALYRKARVLVNPVQTGSGTHVKAVEMLMMRAPIVTTSQGTCGMPPEVKRLFRVADSAEAFAAQIVDALCNPTDCWDERATARRLFGPESVGQALLHLKSLPKARQME